MLQRKTSHPVPAARPGFLPFWILSIAFASCAGAEESVPENEPRLPQVELNAPFRLSASETAEFSGEDLRVTFVEARDDSRCPIGVRCVWAGQVTAVIRLEREQTALGEIKLTRQPGQSEPSKEIVDSYEVELTGIEPYPEEGKTIQPSDYVAVLVVRKEY